MPINFFLLLLFVVVVVAGAVAFTTEKYIMQHLISTLAIPGFKATKPDNSCMHARYCLHYSTSNAYAVSVHAVYVTSTFDIITKRD